MMLILGAVNDPHVNTVCKKLASKSIAITFLDHDMAHDVNLEPYNECYKLTINNKVVVPRLVWYRVKLFYSTSFGDNDSKYTLEFEHYKQVWEREWLSFYDIIASNFEIVTVNNRDAFKKYHSKVVQRKIAELIGFKTPETLITTSKENSVNFFKLHDNIINKALNDSTKIYNPKTDLKLVPMTSRVEQETLYTTDQDSFSNCPTFFQREIPKKYELRIVVVGQHCFAFSIDSQSYGSTKIDWRYGNPIRELFKPYKLSDDVKEKLIKFIKKTGLFYGSFDLIMDLDDQIWFLECNPDGQWMWLDEIVDGKISDGFASEFASLLSSQ